MAKKPSPSSQNPLTASTVALTNQVNTLSTLAGIPTIVYGYLALLMVTPVLRAALEPLGLRVETFNALSACIVVGIMIVPMVSSLSEDVLSAVPRGQTEAALALGLSRMTTLRLVIVPQAMRVIIPPLTNQYLNLTKNSSLAVAIGYPDLVQIFTGTVLNQTAQPVEIVAITMAVYLTISLLTSFLMNQYNARMALVER